MWWSAQLLFGGVFATVCILTPSLAAGLADDVEQSQQDKEQQIFIDHLFHKYGNGGVIGFEGLEHLMESLGLGKIKFDKTHNLSDHKTNDGDFKEVHDELNLHTHEHPRETRSVVDTKEDGCLRPKELLSLYGLEADHGVRISPTRFLQICPAIISQIDSRVCAVAVPKHDHDHSSFLPQTSTSRYLVWAYGLGSIVIVSLCGILGFAFFPLIGKSKCQTLCSLLSSLSIGTLAGDALLHLIPHALHDLHDESTALLKLSFIFLVITALFVYESYVHMTQMNKQSAKSKGGFDGPELTVVGPRAGTTGTAGQMDMAGHDDGGHGHSHSGSIVQMVLGGDFLHNMTDGLAIGAAYGQHPITGFATTIAVLLHEVPHELGDLAILLDSGVSVKKALLFNVVSSLFSLVGAVGGLLIGESEAYAEWIYAFTAGSFLYIAMATLMPEMFKKTKTVGRLLAHTTGIFIGGVIMLLIALYEHEIRDFIQEIV